MGNLVEFRSQVLVTDVWPAFWVLMAVFSCLFLRYETNYSTCKSLKFFCHEKDLNFIEISPPPHSNRSTSFPIAMAFLGKLWDCQVFCLGERFRDSSVWYCVVAFQSYSYKILCQFLPLSQPHPAMNQKCTLSFFGHRSWYSHLPLLLVMIRLVVLCHTWSGALSLIWKCKLVTGASAPLLRAVPPHEHIWPVLHRPCWSLLRCWFTRAINMLRLASLERSSLPLSSDMRVKSADQGHHHGGKGWLSTVVPFRIYVLLWGGQWESLSPHMRGERVAV